VAADVEEVNGEVVAVDPMVAEGVAAEFGGRDVAPVDGIGLGERLGDDRADVVGGLAQLGGEAVLRLLDGAQVLLLLVAEPLLFKAGSDARPQECRVEWLWQVILGALLDAAHDAVEFIERGDHDDRNVAQILVGLEGRERAVAVEHGHEHVEEHEVKWLAARNLERLGSIGGRGGRVPLPLEPAGKRLAIIGVVIDDEDAPGQGHGRALAHMRGQFLVLECSGSRSVIARLVAVRWRWGFLRGSGDEAGEAFVGEVFADHREEAVRGVADFGEIVADGGDAFVGEFLGDEFTVAEDVIDRRAEVVAQAGEAAFIRRAGVHAAGGTLPTRVSWAAIFSSSRGSSIGLVS